MKNTCFVYYLIFWGCILLFKEGTCTPCALRGYGHNNKVCVCNATYCDTVERVTTIKEDEFVAFVSSEEGLRFKKTTGKFSKEGPKETKKKTKKGVMKIFSGKDGVAIDIQTSIKYQKILGFGAAFTDAAGINIMSLDKEAQEKLLRSYFSEDGIEYNIGRVPIGGTDFSTRPYSYDDITTDDPDLEHFALTKEDTEYKIPLINRAKKLSKKELNLITMTWSPPVWMKTNNKWFGSSALKPEHYNTYVKYIFKFLDTYKKHDIKFWAMSTGNEPNNGLAYNLDLNSMGWTPKDLATWTTNHIGPQLRNSEYKDMLLFTYEDQREFLPGYIDDIIKADPKVYQYLDGFTLHWYTDWKTGSAVVRMLHNDYPDKLILYTEACNGAREGEKKVILGDWNRGESYILNILQNLNNWVSTWLDWNLALDLTGGPNWAKNFVDSSILVNATSGEFYKQPMYYAMGHVSKFIEKGARRIRVNPTEKDRVAATAVQNPDGRVVLILVNKNKHPSKVSVKVESKGWIHKTVPKRSFVTILC